MKFLLYLFKIKDLGNLYNKLNPILKLSLVWPLLQITCLYLMMKKKMKLKFVLYVNKYMVWVITEKMILKEVI